MGDKVNSAIIGVFTLLQVSTTLTIDHDLRSPARYFEQPAHRNFSISPSGRYLASVRNLPYEDIDYDALSDEEEEGRRTRLNFISHGIGDQIQIYDFEKESLVKNINIYQQSIYWLHWANDDRLLASISATYDLNLGRKFTFELPAARTISMAPLTDDEPVTLFANDKAVLKQNLYLSNIADPLADDPAHVLMSAYRQGDLDLWRVNIMTGDAQRIATGTPNTFGWIADRTGQPAFRLDQNSNGTIMKVFARSDNNRWRQIIATRLNEKGYGQSFWPIARGRNEHEIFVLSSSQNQPRASISVYDLRNGEISAPILTDKNFDLIGGLIDPHTGEYFGAWLIDDRYRLIFQDESLQPHVRGINAFFDNAANVKLVAASRDLRRLLLEVSAPTIPGEIYAYDRIKKNITPMFDTRPYLRAKDLSPVEMITVTARDGVTFRAYLTHPYGTAANEQAPLIVMPHGGPAARDYYEFDPTAQFLASRGYRVLQPNFRGSSGYGRAFEEAGYREWGGKMQTDVLDALFQIRDRGLIKDKDVCILGSSYGGYVALYAALTTPEYFRCAISIAGVTDLPDILKYSKKIDRDTYDYNVRRIGDPKTEKDLLEERSPARRAEETNIPLLLIHGRYDNVVPYDQFLKLTKALDKNDIEYEWYAVNDGHTFHSLSSTVQTMKRIEKFLATHLGGKSEP